MKVGKKHQGMKAKVRGQKKRERYIATAITITTILIIIVIFAFFVYSMSANKVSTEQTNGQTTTPPPAQPPSAQLARCGRADCPDPALCATDGDCGCS